ncbi:DUF7344 domain-containing protein [Halosolutus gelatinilyticus]|uniref:DUF7344 domain-containing protein n=1 Tax=Halosolutus gelatinilyticus TaxID=2931975 RepID=UPI001FF4A919|nr:hypothetical protein [Halosolutus gelatinilyticus]
MVGSSTEFDAVLELCQDQHRRIILAALAHENRSLTMNDLKQIIVDQNHHTAITELSGEEISDIQISLLHTHIPKLEDLSIVEYDRERQLVEPTPQFEQLEPQLSAIIDIDPGLDPPVTL